MITRKHFIKLAEILGRHDISNELMNDICDFLKETNPIFNGARFRMAALKVTNFG